MSAAGPGPTARGRETEEFAARHLGAAGLSVIGRNYRWRGGEIDLIMRDGDTLVFVEVRYRRRSDHGTPAATVDGVKQRRLGNTAGHFLQRHAALAGLACRFDVVSVSGPGPRYRVEWIRDAFEGPGL